MIDWYARLYVKAGRVHRIRKGTWDVMFGVSYEPRRPDSLVESEIIPPSLMIRFLIWWIEVSWKTAEELRREAQLLHSVR